MKQINDKVIEEMFEKYMTENYGDDYDLGDDLIAHLEYKAAKGGFKAAISLLSDTEVYVEVKTEDEIIHIMRIGLEYVTDADGIGRFFGEREVAKAIINHINKKGE